MLECTALLDAKVEPKAGVCDKDPGVLLGRFAHHVVEDRVHGDVVQFGQAFRVVQLLVRVPAIGR